jgi:hypothetical protein
MEDFLGKFSCAGVVCHCLLLNSLHICPYSIPSLFFHQRTPSHLFQAWFTGKSLWWNSRENNEFVSQGGYWGTSDMTIGHWINKWPWNAHLDSNKEGKYFIRQSVGRQCSYCCYTNLFWRGVYLFYPSVLWLPETSYLMITLYIKVLLVGVNTWHAAYSPTHPLGSSVWAFITVNNLSSTLTGRSCRVNAWWMWRLQ